MSAPFPSFTRNWHTAPYAAIDPTRPELSAAGKTIVITGGGSGLGVSIARAFAKASASRLGLIGRTERTLAATKAGLLAAHPGIEIHTAVADVTDRAQISAAFDSFAASFGRIDVFVNNAGYLPSPGAVASTDTDDWWRGFEINVKGSLLATQAFLRHAATDAVLINNSTGLAHSEPFPGFSGYASSKLAGTKLFDYVQAENPGIRVVNLQPGIVETAMNIKSEMPALDHEDLPGSFIVWLASPEAKFLKGKYVYSNWDVDELKEKAQQIERSSILRLGLDGWPFAYGNQDGISTSV